MTDDYRLFAHTSALEGEQVNPDVAIITAYLAGELSPVQVAAVKHRLSIDADFLLEVAPVIDGWNAAGGASVTEAAVPPLTRSQCDAGWARYQAAAPAGRPSVRVHRISPRVRAAAVIAILALPLIVAAQRVRRWIDRVGSPSAGASHVGTGRPADPPRYPARAIEGGARGVALENAERLDAVGTSAQGPVAHPTGAVLAASPALPGFPPSVVLSDGRVFVNDLQHRRLVLLDKSLATETVALDSVAGRDNSYGASGAALFPFRRDSVLLLDYTSQAFVVIDPRGKISRTIAVPAVAGGTLIGFSSAFGFVYTVRVPAIVRYPNSIRPKEGEPDLVFRYEDTLVVVTVNLDTRAVDTVAKINSGEYATLYRGLTSSYVTIAPAVYPFRDEIGIMSDGTLGILRAREFRMEWLDENRRMVLSPRLPYEWRRITDDDRVRIRDSIIGVRQRTFDSTLARWIRDSTAKTIPVVTTTILSSTGVTTTRRGSARRPTPPSAVELSDIPDFLPPTICTTPGACRMLLPSALVPDAENRVWIRVRPSPSARGDEAPVYDVVDRQGAVVDRVSIPLMQLFAGFGPGSVFLTGYDAGVGASRIQKVSIR